MADIYQVYPVSLRLMDTFERFCRYVGLETTFTEEWGLVLKKEKYAPISIIFFPLDVMLWNVSVYSPV